MRMDQKLSRMKIFEKHEIERLEESGDYNCDVRISPGSGSHSR